LSQLDNPVYDLLEPYEDWLTEIGTTQARLEADSARADNILTWQMPHGGF
jgi:hypothetical protein